MTSKIDSLVSLVDNFKEKLTDNEYMVVVNTIGSGRQDHLDLRKKLRRLRRKCYKIHYQLLAVTEYAVSQEFDSESEADLLFLESF